MELPSAGDLEGLSEILLGLAEEDFSDLSFPEVLEAYKAFCGHPVVYFARRICDVVTAEMEE